MAVELGAGYVSLVPSAKGMATSIAKQLGEAFDDAANKAGDAGQQAGSEFSDGVDKSGGSKLGGVATKLGGILVAGIAGAGALAGAALAKGVADSYAAEAANDKLAAQLGLPPDRAAELGAVAGAVYRDAYGESLTEVNDAIARVMRDGLVPEDATTAQIEGITVKVLDLATAFDQDLGGTTQAVSQLMRTGLADSADEALDIITRGFQQGADKSEDFLDTLNEYGTQFRKMGIDGTEATGLIMQGLKAGARDSDIVADSIKEFSIRAIDGSKLTKESFEGIGLSHDEMAAAIAAGGPTAAAALDQTLDALRAVEDPAERSALAVGLFGVQAEDMGEALFALDLSSASKQMGNVAGAAEAMGNTLNDNAMVKIETFKRQALGALADFAAQYVIPKLAALGTVFQDEVMPRLQVFGAYLQANVVPALQQFGTWIMETIVPALQTAATWIGDHVVPVLQRMGSYIISTIVPAIAEFAGWLGAQLQPALKGVGERAEALWPHLQEIGRRIQDDVLPSVKLMWEQFQNDVLPVLKTVAEYIFRKLIPAYLEIQGKIDGYVLPVLARIVTFIGNVIGAQVELWNTLKRIGDNVVDFVRDAKGALDGLIDFIRELPGRVARLAGGMFDGIKDAFRSAINFVIDGWNNLSFSMPGFDTGIPGAPSIPGFTVNTPNIPRLADGGVFTRSTLALVGETSRARPEIVTPAGLMGDVVGEQLDRRGAGATFHQTFVGSDLTARDVAVEIGWELRTLGAA